MANENNRHYSEAQPLPFRPDAGGIGRDEKQFKQGSCCYNDKDIF